MPRIKLHDIAHARSGDKGASANIGVIARTPEAFAVLREKLTASAVAKWFTPLSVRAVDRYELPNLLALNFLLHDVLDGGGSLTLRIDAQGKSFGQVLLEMPIEVDDVTAEALRTQR